MSRRRIAVVTDSTSCLPPELAEQYQIRVVPLHVCISGIDGLEGADVDSMDIATAMQSRRHRVSTSRPTPEEFAAAYERAFADGATGIVSVHLSSRLSGTYESALLAARGMTDDGQVDRIAVVDARSTGMGLGFAVLAAAEAATAGADLGKVQEVATEASARTTTLFYVDDLEFLRRGGRIGAASALVGTALAVKPLLHVDKGEVVVLERVRTATRALARLVDVTVTAAGEDGIVDVAVQHLAVPERAAEVADRIRDRLGNRLGDLYLTEIGAAVAVHVGPGMVGVVVGPRTP